jgi:hypothetical protein
MRTIGVSYIVSAGVMYRADFSWWGRMGGECRYGKIPFLRASGNIHHFRAFKKDNHNMGSHHSKRVKNQPLPTGLLGLPPEVITCVADFRPLHSAASLAFCNRTLSQPLGTHCWEPLRQRNHEARTEFLSALTKDLPGYFVCHICSLLHLSSGVHPPGPAESRLSHNVLPCV